MNEVIIERLIELAIKWISTKLPVAKKRLSSTVADIEASIANHVKNVETWSSQISFADLPQAKVLPDVVVTIQLRQSAKKFDLATDQGKPVQMAELLDIPSHLIILGDPGAGKTTTIKYLCQQLLHESPSSSEDHFTFPVVVRLRELDADELLHERLATILGIKATVSDVEFETKSASDHYRLTILKRIVPAILDEMRSVVCLDGFDELSPAKMTQVLEEFRELVLSTSSCRILLTCRSGEFSYSVDNCRLLEILPLSPEQISSFVKRWLKKKERASDFLRKLSNSPYSDTAVRPLVLAHLCAIYERYQTIPEKPKTVYKKIINLYLEEWDAQRSVQRRSKYAKFEPDRKLEFLSAIAFTLAKQFGRSVFSTDEFQTAYKVICGDFALPLEEAHLVVAEIESHTGLLLQSGYETYEFAHKSLQEFLCAEHIARLPALPSSSSLIQSMPNEFALAICLSSRASQYFSSLALNHLNLAPGIVGFTDFVSKFIRRLLLEHADFSADALLGVSYFYIATLLYQSRVVLAVRPSESTRIEECNKLLLEFRKLVNVQKSVALALEYYDSHKDNNTVILTRTKPIPEYTSSNYTEKMEFEDSLY